MNSIAPRPGSYNYAEPSSVLSECGLQRLPHWVLSESLVYPRLVRSLSTTNDLLAQCPLPAPIMLLWGPQGNGWVLKCHIVEWPGKRSPELARTVPRRPCGRGPVLSQLVGEGAAPLQMSEATVGPLHGWLGTRRSVTTTTADSYPHS